MAGTIKLKRSAVGGRKPGVNDMALGELALNTFDGKAFLRGNNGADFVREIGVMDDNGNLPVNSLLRSIQSIASSNGVTALTNASNEIIQVTGTAAHTIKLPDATTLKVGRSFSVLNRSTGTVTVQDGSGAALGTVGRGLSASLRATAIASVAGTWDLDAGGGASSSSGSGLKNYLSNPNGYTGTAGWSTFRTTLTGDFPNAAPTIQNNSITFSAVTTNVLSGVSSLQIAGPGATPITVGDGIISDPFTIDNKDLAKMLSVLFDYQVLAGGNGSNLAVYLYNVGAAQWVQPSNYKPFNAINVSSTSPINFQTDYRNTTNFNQYRLAVVAVAAGSAGFSMNFQASVGSQAQLTGVPGTDLTPYTPVFSAGFGTVSNVNVQWRRVGSFIDIIGSCTVGTTSAVVASVSLPPGLITDSVSLGSTVLYPKGAWERTGANNVERYVLVQGGQNSIFFGDANQGNQTKRIVSDLIGAGETFTFYVSLPIQGWGSSVTMSSNDEGRAIAARYYGLPTAQIPANNPFPFQTKDSDTTGAYLPSRGTFVAPVSDFYQVNGRSYSNDSTQSLFIGKYLAGSTALIAVAQGSPQSANIAPGVISDMVWLNQGDAVFIYSNSPLTPSGNTAQWLHSFSVVRVGKNGGVIAASEVVNARYTSTSGQVISGAAGATIINFEAKDYDSHGSVTTGAAWKFVAQSPGIYRVNTTLSLMPHVQSDTGFAIWKNGVEYMRLKEVFTSVNAYFQEGGSGDVKLNVGEYFDLRIFQSTAGNVAMMGGNLRNVITVTKVG